MWNSKGGWKNRRGVWNSKGGWKNRQGVLNSKGGWKNRRECGIVKVVGKISKTNSRGIGKN